GIVANRSVDVDNAESDVESAHEFGSSYLVGRARARTPLRCSQSTAGSRQRALLLLIDPTLVLPPASHVPTLRVVVSPVNDTTLLVPFVLAVELHSIPFPQRIDSRREIDVVRDQKRVPRRQLEDEALVAAAFIVVAQRCRHRTDASNLNVASTLFAQRIDVVLGRTFDRCSPLDSNRRDARGPFDVPECACDERKQ